MEAPQKPLYQHIIELLDFGDELMRQLVTGDAYNRRNYIMILIYIDDILNRGGREIVFRSACDHLESQEEDEKMMDVATKRMDMLRVVLRDLIPTEDIDEDIKSRSNAIYQTWHKRT